jgi:hypothetical protein
MTGAAIVAQAQGKPQFNQWFLYVLLVFVVCTLLVEIIYLNVFPQLECANILESTEYLQCISPLEVNTNHQPDEYSHTNGMSVIGCF